MFRESYELSQKNYFMIQWLLSLDQRSVHFKLNQSLFCICSLCS